MTVRPDTLERVATTTTGSDTLRPVAATDSASSIATLALSTVVHGVGGASRAGRVRSLHACHDDREQVGVAGGVSARRRQQHLRRGPVDARHWRRVGRDCAHASRQLVDSSPIRAAALGDGDSVVVIATAMYKGAPLQGSPLHVRRSVTRVVSFAARYGQHVRFRASHAPGYTAGFTTETSMPMIATGGPRNSKPGTLNQLFFDAVAKYRKPDALQVKRNGRYEPISHDTLAERVRRTALGLEELGVRAGDRVAILSENRPEWAIADYACLTIGAADVPIYPNLPADQIAYILNDSGAVAIFVSTAEQAAKIAADSRRVSGAAPRHLVRRLAPTAPT